MVLFYLAGVEVAGAFVADCQNVPKGAVADGIQYLVVLLKLFLCRLFGPEQGHIYCFITTEFGGVLKIDENRLLTLLVYHKHLKSSCSDTQLASCG